MLRNAERDARDRAAHNAGTGLALSSISKKAKDVSTLEFRLLLIFGSASFAGWTEDGRSADGIVPSGAYAPVFVRAYAFCFHALVKNALSTQVQPTYLAGGKIGATDFAWTEVDGVLELGL